MRFVCFDTATDALSCAVLAEGELLEHHEVAPRQHAERVLAVLDRLLAEAGVERGRLDAVAFGRGPGSFTGLRIAAGVAQGLAFALDVPVLPVSTLAAIAQGEHRESGARRVLALLDARLGEVYAGAFRAEAPGAEAPPDGAAGGSSARAADGGEAARAGGACGAAGAGLMRPDGGERLCRPEDAAAAPEGGGWTGCGPGWAVAGALRRRLAGRLERVEPERLPRARDLAVLARAAWEEGGAVAPERALPVYLRQRVAAPAGAGGRQ